MPILYLIIITFVIILSHMDPSPQPTLTTTTHSLLLPQLPPYTTKSLHPAHNNTHLLHQRKYAISTLSHIDAHGTILKQIQLPNENAMVYMFDDGLAVVLAFTEMYPQCQLLLWDLKGYQEVRVDRKLASINSQVQLMCLGDSKIVSIIQVETNVSTTQSEQTVNRITISCYTYGQINQNSQPQAVIVQETEDAGKLVKINQEGLLAWVSSGSGSGGDGFKIGVIDVRTGGKAVHIFKGGNMQNGRITDIVEVSPGLLYVQTAQGDHYTDWLWQYTSNQAPTQAPFSTSQPHHIQLCDKLHNPKLNPNWLPTLYIDKQTGQKISQTQQQQGNSVQVCYPGYQPCAVYVYHLEKKEVSVLVFSRVHRLEQVGGGSMKDQSQQL